MKKIKGFMIIFMIAMVLVMQGKAEKAEASSKYIKVEDFIEYVLKQMDWEVDESADMPYIDAAMEKGILKKGDFKDYSEYLTRTDAAVIANRLDELVHLKYGYPQEVYEFLKDCSLFEGILYYDINGGFFPKGETDKTYDARNFSKDVAFSIIQGTFPSDSWVKQGLRTKYKDVFNKGGKVIQTFIMIGMPSSDVDNIVEVKPFDENSELVKSWSIIKDSERKLNAVLESRINDIKEVTKAKREAVASIVAKGIIKGYSNGLYVQNREFRGDKKITATGAKNVIQMVLNPEKRAHISPDGQLIRTTKLPKNASDYEYILDSFPNKYYEMKYSFMYLTDYLSGEIRDDEYAYPKEVDYDFLYDNFYNKQMRLEVDKYEYYDDALINTAKYLEHIFGVDYRTVNDKWKKDLASSLSFYSWDKSIYDQIDGYIDKIKKNNVVVEFGKIAIDPGAIYESRNYIYVRAYVKYRVKAKDMSVPTNQLIYGPNTSIKNIIKDVWKEDVFDVFVEYRSENSIYKWGPTTLGLISDWAYRESLK